MPSGWTDKGTTRALDIAFRGQNLPTTFYLALCTNATPPGITTNTLGDLTEITAGTGYTTGGVAVARSAVGFDVLTEADPTLLQLADVTFTASGGSIPTSGSGARWAVLTDDNGTVGSREVLAYFDLVSDRSVSDGQDLIIQNAELQAALS